MINNVKDSIKERLIFRINSSNTGKPWYGKSLKDILTLVEGDLPEEVLALLNHMIAWRKSATAALKGKRYQIPLNTPADWPTITLSSREILIELQNSQADLIDAILIFDDANWEDPPPEADYSFEVLASGVIDHDIYHSGQIAYILKNSLLQ